MFNNIKLKLNKLISDLIKFNCRVIGWFEVNLEALDGVLCAGARKGESMKKIKMVLVRKCVGNLYKSVLSPL